MKTYQVVIYIVCYPIYGHYLLNLWVWRRGLESRDEPHPLNLWDQPRGSRNLMERSHGRIPWRVMRGWILRKLLQSRGRLLHRVGAYYLGKKWKLTQDDLDRIWGRIVKQLAMCYECREGRHGSCSGVATNPLEFHRLVTCECEDPECKERKWEVE